MIGRVCLLLEALSIVICLHHLYGEKFKLDIKTVGFLAVDMIMMTAIDYYGLPSAFSVAIYLILAVYCAIRFEMNLKRIIVNEMMCVVIVGVIQLISSFIYYCGSSIQYFSEWDMLIISIINLLLIRILVPKLKLNNFLKYLQQKERILLVSLFLCGGIIIIYIISFKKYNILEVYQYIILFIVIMFICILTAQLEKYKMKTVEIEAELKMQKIYADSFNGLIENIRLRQHEFDNHINVIFSQHYMYRTYEELVEAQRDYCKKVEEENRYNNILSKGNPIIICFLYDKFMEVERLGIKVSYQISIEELDVGMPIYKIVEILGNLIKNAVDAILQEDVEKQLHVSMVEIENAVEIRVRNVSKNISREKMQSFFEKGYSTKGENRGLGLYNVKRICNEYNFKILCDNLVENDLNWIEFVITNLNPKYKKQ